MHKNMKANNSQMSVLYYVSAGGYKALYLFILFIKTWLHGMSEYPNNCAVVNVGCRLSLNVCLFFVSSFC